MKNLIVPCAGKSSRFPNMRPKWMLTHPEGTPMIYKNLSAMNLDDFNRIIFTIVKEHDEKYDASLFLKQLFPDEKFEVLVLDEFTNGPADTVYQTLIEKKVNGQIVIRDSDSLTVFSENRGNISFIVGLNLCSKISIDRVADKSFIVLNEQNNIVDIVEKKVISQYVCLGIYGVKSHNDFIKSFEEVKNKNINNDEIFVSHIFSHMISKEKELVTYIEAESYEDWGTIKSWLKVLSKNSTYFVDLDGVLFENVGRYGVKNWNNFFKPIDENVECIKSLSNNGAQVIFTTSRPEEYRDMIENYFKNINLNYHSLIMGLNHSPRILINDFSTTNPYPSAKAINVPRNGILSNYTSLDFF